MQQRAFCSWVCTIALTLGGVASAQDKAPPRRAVPGGEGLSGHSGLLRTVSALNQPAGTIAIGTDLEYFSANKLLPGPTAATKLDHSRLVNAVTLLWAPWHFVETAFGARVISNSSRGGESEELQVTVGDPQLSLKGGYEVYPGIAFGGLIEARLLTGAGFLEASRSAFSFDIEALASWSGGAGLPLAAHLNVGFVVDGSDGLFDDAAQLSAAQLFAAQVSSFNRAVTRLGVTYLTKFVGPFIELAFEPFVGSGAPSFADSPGWLSLGAQTWLGKRKDLQLLAAVDIGLTGVGDGSPSDLGDKYAFVTPRWNLSFRVSYRFDPTYEPPPKIKKVVESAARATIGGRVVDSQSKRPVWNATIKVVDSASSPLAVDAKDASFRTFDVPVGRRTLVASANGYIDTRVLLDVGKGGAETVIELTPKVHLKPGTLRGTVTARGGRTLRRATVLLPELDRSVEIGKNGAFSITLKPGQYKVVVSSPGMRTQERAIRVLEGDTVILNVELYK